jgi:hypothetical protein
MKKGTIFVILLIGLIIAMMSATVYAQVVVNIGTPNTSNSLGVNSLNNGYWIGQFPITIYSGTQSTTGAVYCMTPGGTVYEGSNYTATEAPVPNNSTWQAISYILSWNPPINGAEAAIDQVAIWMLLGQNPSGTPPQYNDFQLDQSIITQASSLASSMTANGGMNVALSGDQLQWITPFVGTEGSANVTSAAAGQPVTFQVQLTGPDYNALSIPNVQVDFNALGSTTPEYTNSNGIATYVLAVPQNAVPSSTITVTASTQSVWPVAYLDLLSLNPGTQNLLGVSPVLNLTTSYNIQVSGWVFVLPESAFGALSALTVCAAGFIIYYKLKPQTNRMTP